MPTLAVNDAGTVLQYTDSGAPPGSTDYSTIFLIHGHVFHSAIFRHLFPHAACHNLRLFTINVREYPGSSPLTDEQLASLCAADPAEAGAALFDQVRDIAGLIVRLIKSEDIPTPSKNGETTSGGVSILGWSAGNAFLFSLLANYVALEYDTRTLLGRYLTSVILWDPPCLMLGQSKPANAYSPYEDPAIPPRDIAAHFIPWVSAYNTPIASVSDITVSSMEQLKPKGTTDPKYSPSTTRMTAEELASVTWPGAAVRCPTPMFEEGMRKVYQRNLRRALFDTEGAWRGVRAVLLWPNMTAVYCFWSVKLIADGLREAEADNGKVCRDVHMVKLEDANHFMHYDDPERFTRVLAECVV